MISRIVLLLGMAAAFGQAAEPDMVTYSRRLWQSADGLPEDFAQALAQTSDGYLWIGTSGGLVRFDGIRFTVFNRENTPSFRDDSFYSLLVSKDGALWGGTEGGGLVRYKDVLVSLVGSENDEAQLGMGLADFPDGFDTALMGKPIDTRCAKTNVPDQFPCQK